MPALMSRGRRQRRTVSEINMVPFIDVMLVLLIIFMVTAPLIAPSMVDLPSVGKATRQPDAVVQVIMGRDQSLQVKSPESGSAPAVAAMQNIASVVQRAIGERSNVAVVISADRAVPYEAVVKLMDALQRAGVRRIGLSVQLAG
jgi:biopolymer transport protein TolR